VSVLLLAVPLAFRQLVRDKVRLVVAMLGVAFAVVLMFMQLGFQDALYKSCVRYHESLRYDLAMLSPRTTSLIRAGSFSRRRLHQVRRVDGVEEVTEVYVGQVPIENPADPSESKQIFVFAYDPEDAVFREGVLAEKAGMLRWRDTALFDEHSRAEFGPIPELLRADEDGVIEVEVANRSIRVIGLFRLGTSFGIDGSLITSDLNFLRLFPGREPGAIDLGLIGLAPGVDPAAMATKLDEQLPPDVLVLTRDQFVQREVDYWSSATPIGYVFSMGVIIGLVAGGSIVDQILFADVSEHIQEYATLKAMGYADGFLMRVVMRQAAMLALLGFLPGIGISALLYEQAGGATRLPLALNAQVMSLVLGLTVAMCVVAGAIALRKVRTADPADVF